MKVILLHILLICFSQVIGQVKRTNQLIEINYEGIVYQLNNINTKGVEFSPVWHNNQLIFTGSREFDKLSLGENNWSKNGYLNVYKAKVSTEEISADMEIKKAKLFSENIKSISHTGPVCFSASGDTIFFSQTLSKKRGRKLKVYKPQLYMAVKKGKIWGDIQSLPFNDSKYSFSHPTYNSKTYTLYFTSDKTGGKGGKDIYASTLSSEWSTPKNIEHINTKYDEVFPFVIGNDIFMASNRSDSRGGLDIYWANLNSEAEVKNIESINTEFDDFGIFLLPSYSKGFLSSNKSGNDDIYFLEMTRNVKVNSYISGNFKYRNLNGKELQNIKVMLIDESGYIAFTTFTDVKGNFIFKNLKMNANYTIKTEVEDELDLFIYNNEGTLLANLLNDSDNKFVYKNLKFKDVGTLSLIPDDYSDFEMQTGHLSGQFIFDDKVKSYPNKLKVKLVDEKGETKFIEITDERGNFDFRNLTLKENYILTIDENIEGLTLYIYDKKGNVVTQLKSNKKGQFTYRKLKGEFNSDLNTLTEDDIDDFLLENKTISGGFNYRNLKIDPITSGIENKLMVLIYDEDGILIATEKVNEKGEFRFRNLPLKNNFLFKLNNDGEFLDMDDFSLYIEDRYGKKIAQLQRGQNGYFNYKPLGFNLEENLSTIVEDSLGFELITTKVEIIKVFFNSNKTKVKSEDLIILKKIEKQLKSNTKLTLEINAYADSRSSDDYNLILSAKRADWIVKYLLKKGIDKKRFTVNAYGEGQLAIQCKDCTDEDHAKNRRAELRLY